MTAKKREGDEEYDLGTHRDIYNRINANEIQTAKILSGIRVVAVLFLCFAGMFWQTLNGYASTGRETLEKLSSMEQLLKTYVDEVKVMRTSFRDHELDVPKHSGKN